MRKSLPAIALAIAAVIGPATPSEAQPRQTGCPSAFELRTVEQWAADGYTIVPAMIDDSGNRDGNVCGLDMPEGYRFALGKAFGVEPSVEVIYLFTDNDNASARG